MTRSKLNLITFISKYIQFLSFVFFDCLTIRFARTLFLQLSQVLFCLKFCMIDLIIYFGMIELIIYTGINLAMRSINQTHVNQMKNAKVYFAAPVHLYQCAGDSVDKPALLFSPVLTFTLICWVIVKQQNYKSLFLIRSLHFIKEKKNLEFPTFQTSHCCPFR